MGAHFEVCQICCHRAMMAGTAAWSQAAACVVLAVSLGVTRGDNPADSPGASLDWTKQDPHEVTQYLLNQVKAASKSWDKIPGQVREAKHTTEKVKKLTEQAGEAVKGVQDEMNKAYALVAGVGSSEKMAAATKQASDSNDDSPGKHDPRAEAAVESFFDSVNKTTQKTDLQAEEKEQKDWLQHVEKQKELANDEVNAINLDNEVTKEAEDNAGNIINSKPALAGEKGEDDKQEKEMAQVDQDLAAVKQTRRDIDMDRVKKDYTPPVPSL